MSVLEVMNVVYLLLKIIQILINIYQIFNYSYRSSEYLKILHDNVRENNVFFMQKYIYITDAYVLFASKEIDQKNADFVIASICSIRIQLLLSNDTNKLSVQDGNPHAHD